MREIERNIISAIRSNTKAFGAGNTTISYNEDFNVVDVFLHGHKIATIDKDINCVRLSSCGYMTNVTKSRLNCVLSGLYSNLRVYQRNKMWYIGNNYGFEKEFVDGISVSY